MIVESIALGVFGIAAVIVSSLGFTYKLIKKQREWDDEDAKEPEPEPTVYPFLEVRIGTKCPKCLAPSANATFTKNAYGENMLDKPPRGLKPVRSCNGSSNCSVKRLHFHVSCNSCQADWMMEQADYKEKENAL